jgi:hypothetical protein
VKMEGRQFGTFSYVVKHYHAMEGRAWDFGNFTIGPIAFGPSVYRVLLCVDSVMSPS